MNKFKAGIIFYSIGLAINILAQIPSILVLIAGSASLVFWLISDVIYIFLTWQMACRKNWAKIALLILFCLSTFAFLWKLIHLLHDPNQVAVMYIAGTGIAGCLFKGIGLLLVFADGIKKRAPLSN